MVNLTKKHFIEIAKILKNNKKSFKDFRGVFFGSCFFKDNTLKDLCDFFKELNHLFNEKEFKKIVNK
jgi:hypothetical protein